MGVLPSDNRIYDRIIIGAGLYGMYAARACALKGDSVLLLEYDDAPFSRATYVNQARVHMGYHYPRSLSTATKSAGYFRRFVEDYGFAIHKSFRQVYATSAQFSWTNGTQFASFCKAAGIQCEEISPNTFFQPGMCDGAFLTEEYTYDALVLRDHFLQEISALEKIELCCNARIQAITAQEDAYYVRYIHQGTEKLASAPFVLNATYASSNQVMDLVDGGSRSKGAFSPFDIKYELCEIILCRPSEKLKNTGITVMDGPFFSIMPFGLTGYHSLTAVTFTPHVTSYDTRPSFACQRGADCSPEQLGNCNTCPHKPESAWPYMDHLARKYLLPEYTYTFEKALYSMKPILKSSEVDDSRPTSIRVNSTDPTFISVLSGKINTVYDLDEYLI